jgi:hypothetical protein
MQHYVIKLISALRQVGGFLWVIRFSPPIIKINRQDITEILSIVALNTIALTLGTLGLFFLFIKNRKPKPGH